MDFQDIMNRPDKLIFVAEVGSNTNTSKDGNIGGEMFLLQSKDMATVSKRQQRIHISQCWDSQLH
jgi:hypothetical protein